MRINVLPVLFLLFAQGAFALAVDIPLPDATQEARAKILFRELRCVVCQSESVADSQTEVARDIRTLIRAQIAEGKTGEEIRAYLVSRYGEFILMQPPVKVATLPLWLGPLLFLACGGLLAWRIFRRNGSARS